MLTVTTTLFCIQFLQNVDPSVSESHKSMLAYSSVYWSLTYFWGFDPALVSYCEPGRGSEASSVRFPLAPNLDALRCLRCAKRSPDSPDRSGALVNAQASQDVASSSSSDLARPHANVAPKPKPKPSPRLGRGKPKPRAMGSMAPINHHFSPLLELPPLPPGFILPPDVFALLSQGPVQDENSAKRPRLM